MYMEITAKSEIPACNQWHASQYNIRFRVWFEWSIEFGYHWFDVAHIHDHSPLSAPLRRYWAIFLASPTLINWRPSWRSSGLMTRAFLRAARHPADSDGRPTVSCPGTGHGTQCTMASVPLWGSTALQSAVSLWEMFTLLKRWARFCSNRLRRELPAFWTELLSCLVITCHNLWQAITGQHNLS